MGRADLEPLGGLGALRARATLWHRAHGRARRIARAHGPVALRRHRAAVGYLLAAARRRRLRRLKDWIDAGGTLVTLGEASRWATREGVGLLDARTELRDGSPESEAPPKPKADASKAPFDYDKAIAPPAERPELVPGAILRVTLDPEHPLGAGTDGEVQAMVESQRVFTPVTLDKGRNVGIYAKKDRLVASGIAWPESRDQLPQKAYLIEQPMGRGRVVAFAEDPNARAFAETTQLLFVNAILFGPAR